MTFAFRLRRFFTAALLQIPRARARGSIVKSLRLFNCTIYRKPRVDLPIYHLDELEIVNNLADPRRAVPAYPCANWRVLDVGCGAGQTLTAVEFRACRERHGIDVDAEAVAYGREHYPMLKLSVAGAERIPYPTNMFDLSYSRVSLPYTNVPVALAEMHRVTKRGGRVWFMLHGWQMERGHIAEAIKTRSLRRLIDRSYVMLNGLLLRYLGRCFARPWSGTYESIQTEAGIRRLLRRAGFVDVVVHRDGHFIAEAVKA